jgi:hypothetical protein
MALAYYSPGVTLLLDARGEGESCAAVNARQYWLNSLADSLAGWLWRMSC